MGSTENGKLVIDSFKLNLTPDIKATLLVVARTHVLVKKPFKDHLKKRYSEWLLTVNCALNGDGRMKKPNVTCWSVDHNSEPSGSHPAQGESVQGVDREPAP